MNQKNGEEVFSGVIFDETTVFTITEICEHCDIREELVVEMIEYGLVEPRKKTAENIFLDLSALRRIQSAIRLREDFEMNMQATALVLELLDDLDKMRNELAILQKHLK